MFLTLCTQKLLVRHRLLTWNFYFLFFFL